MTRSHRNTQVSLNFFLFSTIILTISCINGSQNRINLEKISNQINSDPQSTWKADSYGYTYFDIENFSKSRFGTKLSEIDEILEIHENKTLFHQNPKPLPFEIPTIDILPKSFDAREKYPYCQSISHISDQSNCASCWAISAASVLSDRLCIRSKGLHDLLLSPEHLLACNKANRGCRGGGLVKTWEYLKTQGTVTGGDFHSDEGCQPYSIRPCGWPRKLPCSSPISLSPKCNNIQCTNEWHDEEYEPDVIKVDRYYKVSIPAPSPANEFFIRNEIYNNGPVQAAFLVYEDFLTYKSGIYKRNLSLQDTPLSGLSVRIIGWGEENGIKYWLIANSWSDQWGEGGTFRMIRGQNECLLETLVFAAEPKI